MFFGGGGGGGIATIRRLFLGGGGAALGGNRFLTRAFFALVLASSNLSLSDRSRGRYVLKSSLLLSCSAVNSTSFEVLSSCILEANPAGPLL